MKTKVLAVKIVARAALGLVWLYEGLIPKILFLRADELDLVQRSGIWWGSPTVTLTIMGASQMIVGLWLIFGWQERIAVSLATLWMCLLIALVARGNPGMLTDPYGALIKDLCLIACAVAVWILAPMTALPLGRDSFEPTIRCTSE